MTEHVVSFSVGIDDAAIIKNVQEKADKQIIQEIKKDVLNVLFDGKYYNQNVANLTWDGKIELNTNGATLSDLSQKILKDFFKEYKDEIINAAANQLADSYKRTKAWKEKTASELA